MFSVRALNAAPRWVRRAVTTVTQGRGPLGALYDRVALRLGDAVPPALPPVDASPVRLVIGPANEAEQGFQWARAVERSLPGVSAVAMMGFDPGGYGVQADLVVPRAVYLRSAPWHDAFEAFLRTRTHVVIESALPLLGRRYRTDVVAEVRALRAAGVQVALLFHGSDLRPPSQHRRELARSPFTNPELPSTILEDKAAFAAAVVAELGGPVFVSTPDLLRYQPDAVWCPVVIDVERWSVPRDDAPPRSGRPVVLHAPSNPLIKGSHLIDPVLRALEGEGLIEYRRVQGLTYAQMRQQYAECDIVLDQFLIGSYGVAACEALAAGCVVVGHVDPNTRRTVHEQTGIEVPIVDATVDTLDSVLRSVIAEPAAVTSERRREAVRFVGEVHDGRRSADALRGFLRL
ncbi:glycosyltransferase [Microcella sp.]|uniref:glycosyltransferase n=1 Tax=Microcella sp. TaxID=1913979 RepID=UPI003F712902